MSNWLSNDWCSTFMLALGHFLWQGTLIAVTLAVLIRAASLSSVRYRLSLSALLLMAVCPVITLVWQTHPVTLSTSVAVAGDQLKTDSEAISKAPGAESPAVGQDSLIANTPSELPKTLPQTIPSMTFLAPAESSTWERIAPLLTSLYLSGVVLLLLRLAIGLWGGRTLRNQSKPVTESYLLAALQRQAAALGLKLQPALAYCEHVTVPTVMGIFRPMILLPLSITSGLTPDQLESILAHELAHLRRYDHVMNLLQRVIESLLFFHPAVWWVSNRVREERENCCDDLVVGCGAVPFDYAASLLRVAELSRPSTLRPSIATVSLCATGSKPSSLRHRIARLLGESLDSHVRFRHLWPVISLCTVCGLLAAAALKVGAQSGDNDSRPAIANLPGNITVELVGATFHTSKEEKQPDWWTPSGGPLAKVPIPESLLKREYIPKNHRLFAVKVRGTPDAAEVNIHVSRADERVDFSTWGGGYIRKDADPPILWTAGPFVQGKQTTVRVMLLVDEWGPLQRVSTEAKRINQPELPPAYERCYGNIAPQQVEEDSGRTTLTFRWPANQDYLATSQVWAIDKDGMRNANEGTAGPIEGREFMFALPLSEIDHFEYQLRPYRHWVTFDNVSVQPGHHTPVKVTVESLETPHNDITSGANADSRESSQSILSNNESHQEDVNKSLVAVESRLNSNAGPDIQPLSFAELEQLVESLGGNCHGSKRGNILDATVQIGGEKVDDAVIRKLASYPHLEILRLYDNVNVTDEGLSALAECPDLSVLELFAPAVTDIGMKSLARMPKLEYLTLSGTKVTDAGLQHLIDAPALTFLSLWSPLITDAGMTHVARMAKLDQFDCYCSELTDDGLKAIAQSSSVTSVSIANGKFSDRGIEFLSGLKGLSFLTVYRAPLTDESLRSLGKCTTLKSLRLSECSITDAGLKHLSSLSMLHGLHLTDGHSVSGSGIADLKSLPLRELSLAGSSVTNETIRQLRQFPEIQHLYVGFGTMAPDDGQSYGLTDEGLEHLKELKNLTHLTFDGAAISDAGVLTIAQPHLKYIQCLRCPLLTIDGVKAWRAATPGLQITVSDWNATRKRPR